MDHPRIIYSAFGGGVDFRPYHKAIPNDLLDWRCYLSGGGHSIAVVPASLWGSEPDPADLLVPAPVKAVLRCGYEIRDGWVVADLPYDRDLGLVTDPGDDEF